MVTYGVLILAILCSLMVGFWIGFIGLALLTAASRYDDAEGYDDERYL